MVKIVLHASNSEGTRNFPRDCIHVLFQVRCLSIEDQDILFLLHFEYLCHVFSSLICLKSSDVFDDIG